MTDEQMQKKVARGVEWVLDDVDATDDQIAEVTRVLQSAVPEVSSLRAERKALASEFQVALRKQTVDPAELEALRQKALTLVDKASARGTQALAEAANKLTPEQRAELVSKWQRRMGS
jgi:Spy/CpxP family protein refolding chaperone